MLKVLKLILVLIFVSIAFANPASAQDEIYCGEALTGSINAASEKDTFTFSASANDKALIHLIEKSGDLYLELYNPAGTKLTGIDSGNIRTTLSTDGTYTLIVRGYSSTNTGSYGIALQRLNNPCSTFSIGSGETAFGSITSTVPLKYYSFTASADDKVTVRITEFSGDLYLELYSPEGANLGGIDSGKIDATLPVTGTYTMVVRGYSGSKTGDYSVTWQKLNNPGNAEPINCGQAASGSITSLAPLKYYVFTASANDKVNIRFSEIEGDLYLELYSPDGTRLAGIDSGSINAALTKDGIYTLIVRGYSSSNIGSYSLVYQKLNNPCNATAINCGQAASGSIVTVGETDFYTFTASVSDKVTIRIGEVSGDLYLELYDSTGTRLAGIDSGRIDTTLTAGGTYTLFVRGYSGTNTGNYTLVWQKLNNPCNATAIECGLAISGSIDSPGETDFYTFTASANDKVFIPFTQISGDLYLELYAPNGTRLSGIDSGTINSTLPVDGTYTVIARAYYSADTGDYAFSLQKLNNPCNAVNIAYGDTVSGEIINPAQINAYVFSALGNDTVTICPAVNSTISGSFDIYLELYDSSGNLLGSSSGSLKHTFASGGSFYLFVTESYRDGTGTYKVALLSGDVSCSSIDLVGPEVSLVQPVGGEVIEGGSSYTIAWASSDDTGIASQEIRLSTDSGLNYSAVIASNLPQAAQSYDWHVPADLSTMKGRIKVIAIDAANNAGEDESNDDFMIIKTALPADAKDYNYEYDKLSRLTRAYLEASAENIYTYDTLGNRLTLNIGGGGLPQEWILILPAPWYEEEKDYYSAAASSKMVLDFIRQDAALTQDEIHNYATTESRNLNPSDVQKTLNHFKPALYNFGIIAKSDIADAVRDIVHWMDYEVPGTEVPNSPVLIPTFGKYDNWMVVKGAAASEDPNANQNPWQTGSFTVYGFWLNDPATEGIGENSYKTAAQLQETYYLPLSTGDAWSGKFAAVAEPPEKLSRAKVRLAEPFVAKSSAQAGVLMEANDEINSGYAEGEPGFFSSIRSYSLSSRAKNLQKRIKQFDWRGTIDPILLKDADFNAAIKGAAVYRAIKVKRLDSENNHYYLIPFDKIVNGERLTCAVLILDGSNRSFKEASCIGHPVKYPPLTREEAIRLVKTKAGPAAQGKIPKIRAELVWEAGNISTSPYKPFWKVTMGNQVCFVTDKGEVAQ